MDIADAPWIEETMRTGHYRFGWWNQPYEEQDEYEQEDEQDDEG